MMNNAPFGKTMDFVRKNRDIKLATTEKEERNYYQNQIIIPQSFSQRRI